MYCAPASPLWPSMSKFGMFSKTYKKGGNSEYRGSNMLKFMTEVTNIDAHIILKFQLCTSNISEVIAKSVLIDSFQDPPKTHKKHANFHNKGGSQLKFMTRDDHYRYPYDVKILALSSLIWAKLLQQVYPVAFFQDPSHFKTLVTNSALQRLFGSFQDPCFSLFAAQWQQNSLYFNPQCLTGRPRTSNMHLRSGKVKSP